jgi:hypothetical protein
MQSRDGMCLHAAAPMIEPAMTPEDAALFERPEEASEEGTLIFAAVVVGGATTVVGGATTSEQVKISAYPPNGKHVPFIRVSESKNPVRQCESVKIA